MGGGAVRLVVPRVGRWTCAGNASKTGGSGRFYYVVAVLNKETGYEGSQGLLLGDRITPQTTEIEDGKFVVVNYADRKVGEDFSVQPSVAKSIKLSSPARPKCLSRSLILCRREMHLYFMDLRRRRVNGARSTNWERQDEKAAAK